MEITSAGSLLILKQRPTSGNHFRLRQNALKTVDVILWYLAYKQLLKKPFFWQKQNKIWQKHGTLHVMFVSLMVEKYY
jgi:hypothetical protein